MIRSSPDRNSFQRDNYLKNRAKEGKTPENDEDVKAMVEYYDQWTIDEDEREVDPKWQQNNLEYDLRTSDFIAEKCKDKIYAQHLYAALCNNDFIKNDVWLILKEVTWGCSWRHAGVIVANIREVGDYIDWYCSGMKQVYEPEEIDSLTEDQKEIYKEDMASVNEGMVTDEIKNDLLKLGWLVAENNDT